MQADRAAYERIAALVGRTIGLSLDQSKDYLIETRLAPLCRKLGMTGLGELGLKLAAESDDSELSRAVIQALSTNETWWFRDPKFYSVFTKQIAPRLISAWPIVSDAPPRLRVWSAAASSGQEPYSLAMSWLEAKRALPPAKLELVASDYHRDVLAQAKLGIYSQLEVGRGLPAQKLIQHFDQREDRWELQPQVREHVNFIEHNLLAPRSIGENFDLVICRNVLIYFPPDLRQRVLDSLISAMSERSYLVLGGAENLIGLRSSLIPCQIAGTSIYRKPAAPELDR